VVEAQARTRVPRWIWAVGGGLLLLGAIVVWLGACIHGLSDYERSIFVNVGTAIGLIGPLFLGERLLSRRIAEVGERADAARTSAEGAEQAIEATRSELDELRQQFRAGLEREREADRSKREWAATGSFDDLVALYRQAADHRSIDRLGLRVLAGQLDFALRVRAVERAPAGERMWLIELNFENDALVSLGNMVVWSPGEDAADVFLRLAEEIRRAGQWPGDNAFDPEAFLASITDGLGKVIEIRTGPRGDREVRQIIEVVNDDWAVTREGLDSLPSPSMWAEHDELHGDTNPAFHRLESLVKVRGANVTNFRIAFELATRIHTALEKTNPAGGGPPWRPQS
jgi:hypothetical protein